MKTLLLVLIQLTATSRTVLADMAQGRVTVVPGGNVLFINPGETKQVRITAWVDLGREEFWCPEEQWDWGEGANPSTHQSDCAPFAESANEAAKPRPFNKTLYYHTPGIKKVTFRLINGSGQTVFFWEKTITIRDGAEVEEEEESKDPSPEARWQ